MRKSVDNVNQEAGTPVNAPETDVLELVHAVMHDYRSRQYRFLRDGPHDITHMDGKVLGFFGRRPGATQSDLVQHTGRDKAQLARLVKGLRERGLLQAQEDEADRRSVRLSLTDEGRAIQRTLQQQAARLRKQAVAGLDEAERAQLTALLQRVKTNLG
ncbi:MarR family transcriptional regulator [uncultured Ramlibacter sp.]|uniref:MarR family winged helix-turn-helix transcriptional regulator n=1 Tax=uncultured Ramlibacter sp. TaxID=260755 RepID=UPI00260F145E|nr:MarR family transcriptional regulator [uncultured Ramlibacter sp.]